jgi:antirestriction protein
MIIKLNMRVWVGCLACYNGGRLNGEWLDAADAETFDCVRSDHEEMWCLTSEGMPVSSEMSPATAVRWAELVDAADDVDVLTAFVRIHRISDPDDAELEDYAERYAGYAESDVVFAQQQWEETRCDEPITEWPYSCIDWEHAARELMYDYDSETVNGITYYFRIA